MVDKVTHDARVYADVQGLEQLRYQSHSNTNAAKKEVSQQFEAMLMQIVVRSMRDANKAFASDLFGSDQMDFYQDMFDKQLTLLTSNSDIGFAKMIEKNIDDHYLKNKAHQQEDTTNVKSAPDKVPVNHVKLPTATTNMEKKSADPLQVLENETPYAAPTRVTANFSSPEAFVKGIWSSAKVAARLLGTDPRFLIAQAALETNWGKKILPQSQNTSSHNLFNIKADSSWDKATTTMSTLEQKNGIIAKEKATFRSYDSVMDSFLDYVSFLKQNGRYADALNKATNPQQFAHALQNAGFATDANYADKILKIFSSKMFNNLVANME